MKVILFLKSFDLFGKPFNFKVAGSDSYKTIPGAFLSMIAYILFLYFLYDFGKDILIKENLFEQINIVENRIDPIASNISNDFFCAIKLEDGAMRNIYDLRFFEFQFIYDEFVYNETTGGFSIPKHRTSSLSRCNA